MTPRRLILIGAIGYIVAVVALAAAIRAGLDAAAVVATPEAVQTSLKLGYR